MVIYFLIIFLIITNLLSYGELSNINLSITTDKEFNLINIGKKIKFSVNLSGVDILHQTQKCKLKIIIMNFYQNKIIEKEVTVELINGKIYEEKISFTQSGFYNIKFLLNIENKIIEKKVSIGVLPSLSPPSGDSPFGINSGIPKLLNLCGIKWVRIDIAWSEVEQEKGKFQFDKVDRIVNEFRDHNINILGVLRAPPEWARRVPKDYRPITTGVHAGWGDFPPNDINAWGNYVYQTVNHFKDKIKYWEIWNEPNVQLFFNSGTSEDYVELLKVAYRNAKRANPNCKIVGLGGADYIYAEDVFNQGGLNYMDIASIHVYHPLGHLPEKGWFIPHLKGIKQIIKQFKVSKKVWITEMGFPTHIGFCEGWFGVKEEEQAKYLIRSIVIALSEGIEKFFWFSFRNGIDITNFEHNQGIMYYDLTPKPAFITYSVLTRMLSELKFKEKIRIAPQTYGYLFTNSKSGCCVVWNASKRQQVRIKNILKAYDSMGNKINEEEILILDNPIYIQVDNEEELKKLKKIFRNAITKKRINI